MNRMPPVNHYRVGYPTLNPPGSQALTLAPMAVEAAENLDAMVLGAR